MKYGVLNLLRSWWSPEFPRPTSPKAACCVEDCARSPVLVVARRGRSETLMCLGHAREWVASDECRAIARDNAPGNVTDVQRWTPQGDSRGALNPFQVGLQ